MYTPERLKKLSLLGVAPLAAASIWGGVALATSDSAGNDSLSATFAISEQAASGESTRSDEFIAALATKLGIDEQTLRDALKATSIDQINAKLAAGEITQEQADAAIARVNESNGSFFGPGGLGGPGHHGGGPGGPGFVDKDALATFLGIDEATLRSELDAGATFAQVAEANGKTRDELKTFLSETFNTAIDEKVAAGDLTAEDAATRKQDFADNLDSYIDSVRPLRGDHGPRSMDDDEDGGSEDAS